MVKEKWDKVAMALGVPPCYSSQIEGYYLENLQLLDLHYKTANKIQKPIEKDCIRLNGIDIELQPNNFTGFIMIMEIVKGTTTTQENQNILSRKFNDMIA